MLDLSARLNASLHAPPEPGVYPGIPEHEYHSWRCASNSGLTVIYERSPAHLKARWDNPENDDTPAKIFGRASHCAILEPDDFEKRYAVLPEGDGRTAKVRGAKAEIELRLGPGHALPQSAFDRCLRIRDALHRHSRCGPLLRALTHREVTVVWDDAVPEDREHNGRRISYPASGARCKARLDGLTDEYDGAIVDLKSCECAVEDAFMRSVWSYGYHRQGGLYLEGTAARALPIQNYVIIAYEKEPPFALEVYRATEAMIEAGQQQVRPLLRRFQACVETGEWTAYDEKVKDLTLPDFAWSRIEQETR